MTLADTLRPHVEAIEKSAARGNVLAQEVIRLYRMHCDCPADPGAPALCKATFADWQKSQSH